MNLDQVYNELKDGFVYIYFPAKYDPIDPKSKVIDNGIYKFCDIEINDNTLQFLKKMRNDNARFLIEDYKYYYSHERINTFVRREISEVHKFKNAFSYKCSILLKKN